MIDEIRLKRVFCLLILTISATIMSVQEEHHSHFPATGETSLHLSTITEHLNAFAPKARKPYTITKQRERWTEDEHDKFLEALKLYGRAWRRIEEHLGTKTAVQIRSHAQKFFTKVAREPTSTDGDFVKPIVIPPPRPKRKPMHPYPRKLTTTERTGISVPEKYSNMENQSPTSVLSTVGSDSSTGLDFCTPNGNPSDSSDVPKLTSEEHCDENSSTDVRIPMELDLSSLEDVNFATEDSYESTTQSLKLFGKTLLVSEPSYSSRKTSEPESSFYRREETSSLPRRVAPLKFPTRNSEYVWNCQLKNPIPFPWLTLCSSNNNSDNDALVVLNPEVRSPNPVEAQNSGEKEKMSDNGKEEGSSTSSNTTTDLISGKNGKSFSSYKLSKLISADSSSFRKGFMPYKRRISEQKSMISLSGSGEGRNSLSTYACEWWKSHFDDT